MPDKGFLCSTGRIFPPNAPLPHHVHSNYYISVHYYVVRLPLRYESVVFNIYIVTINIIRLMRWLIGIRYVSVLFSINYYVFIINNENPTKPDYLKPLNVIM